MIRIHLPSASPEGIIIYDGKMFLPGKVGDLLCVEPELLSVLDGTGQKPVWKFSGGLA